MCRPCSEVRPGRERAAGTLDQTSARCQRPQPCQQHPMTTAGDHPPAHCRPTHPVAPAAGQQGTPVSSQTAARRPAPAASSSSQAPGPAGTNNKELLDAIAGLHTSLSTEIKDEIKASQRATQAYFEPKIDAVQRATGAVVEVLARQVRPSAEVGTTGDRVQAASPQRVYPHMHLGCCPLGPAAANSLQFAAIWPVLAGPVAPARGVDQQHVQCTLEALAVGLNRG